MESEISRVGDLAFLESPSGYATIVDGSTFAISSQSGDITPGTSQGLFFNDMRCLSLWTLRVNGVAMESLTYTIDEPYSVTFVNRARPRSGSPDSTLLGFRTRTLASALTETILLHNYASTRELCRVSLSFDADFAHVFDVKEGIATAPRPIRQSITQREIIIEKVGDENGTNVTISFDRDFRVDGNLVEFTTEIEPNGSWELNLRIQPDTDIIEANDSYRLAVDIGELSPKARLAHWRTRVPRIETECTKLSTAIRRAQEDLGALRIFDARYSTRPVIAAGAPWFMALFGRDSLISSWMTLIADQSLSLGVLETLARFQGRNVNSVNEESPGKILHEIRNSSSTFLNFNESAIYYGSVDATPLFVMSVGELRRWGLADSFVSDLMPNVDRAIEWMENYGDMDGDGFLEYHRSDEHGLRNQGWKDSTDCIRFQTGDLANGPIALAEVQGYAYAAYRARRWFALEAGDHTKAVELDRKAAQLKKNFNAQFWMPEHGYFAMALDGDKRQVDALASNIGHCLWTGIVDGDKAEQCVRRLMSDEMHSGWGIRTLATSMTGFNPIGYHTGSVWPHDTAICAAGMRRYGFAEEARRVIMNLLDASERLDGRLPELFSGVERQRLSCPVSFPTACSPQAWASASALFSLRILLGLKPAIPQGHITLDPQLAPDISYLRVDNIPLNGQRISIEVDNNEVHVEGLDPSIEINVQS